MSTYLKGIPSFLLFVFLVTLNLSASHAQVNVNKIQFEGVKKYKINFLRQFLTAKENTSLDSSQLNQDTQVLLNLRGMTSCKYLISENNDSIQITFVCSESLTILPLFNFGTIEDNKWFRIGAVDANLLGREIYLASYYQYNTRNSFLVKSRIPYIKGNKWGALVNFTLWRDVEPFLFEGEPVNYDYDNLAIETGIIRHFNLNQKLDLSVSYFQESYNRSEGQSTDIGPDQNNDEKFVLKAVFRSTKLNYSYHYVNGFSNALNVQSLYSIPENTPYYIVFNETRCFKHADSSNKCEI